MSSSADRQLPTIRSRAQIIRFQPLADELVEKLLVEKIIVPGADEAKHVSPRSAPAA